MEISKWLEEDYILSNWNPDNEEGDYFIHLNNGDSIGYNVASEQFSLNNYWNERPVEEIKGLIKKYGVDD